MNLNLLKVLGIIAIGVLGAGGMIKMINLNAGLAEEAEQRQKVEQKNAKRIEDMKFEETNQQNAEEFKFENDGFETIENIGNEPQQDEEIAESEIIRQTNDTKNVGSDQTFDQEMDEIMNTQEGIKLIEKLRQLQRDGESTTPEIDITGVEFTPEPGENTTTSKDGSDDDDHTPPGGGTSATTSSESVHPENISEQPELTPEEQLEFESLEVLVDEMGESIKTRQRIEANEDEAERILYQNITEIYNQFEQLLELQLSDKEIDSINQLKDRFEKDLNDPEKLFTQEDVRFYTSSINEIWNTITQYQIATPQIQTSEVAPSVVNLKTAEVENLRYELQELLEEAKRANIEPKLLQAYTNLVKSEHILNNPDLANTILTQQLENLKLEIVTKTLKDIQQNQPFAIGLETQKLITDSELVKTAIQRNSEFLLPEFMQNLVEISKLRLEKIQNDKRFQLEKQAIIFLLSIISTIFKDQGIIPDQPLFTQPTFESRADILEAIQEGKKVIYTDKNGVTFLVEQFKNSNDQWLKLAKFIDGVKVDGFGSFPKIKIGKGEFQFKNFSLT
jgi:hypothetical protein